MERLFVPLSSRRRGTKGLAKRVIFLCVCSTSLVASFVYPEISLRQRRQIKYRPPCVSLLPRMKTERRDEVGHDEITRASSGSRVRRVFMVAANSLFLLVALPAFAADDLLYDLDPRFFIAGGLCAAVSHGVTTPIDVVKTRIQADPATYNRGVLSAATAIVQEDGPGSLLTGLGPTVIGYGLEGAAKFGLYETLKPELTKLLHLENPAIPYLIASVVAGAVASIILCPMERTRIRLVTEPSFASNLLTGIPCLIEESGVAGLFSGLPAMLSKQVPYTTGKQISFDAFAAMLYGFATSVGLTAMDVKLEVSAGAAFLASLLACILSHPGDVILTATYKGSKSRDFDDVVSTIYRDDGIKGFLSGIGARFLHVGTIITSQLVLYDIVKQLLGLPATGMS